jgi:predicted amidophosphoribosyltransferase
MSITFVSAEYSDVDGRCPVCDNRIDYFTSKWTYCDRCGYDSSTDEEPLPFTFDDMA